MSSENPVINHRFVFFNNIDTSHRFSVKHPNTVTYFKNRASFVCFLFLSFGFVDFLFLSGDIGNTSLRYAKAFYEALPFDSITVAPYMGEDSVAPFLSVEDKHTILLALTSNKGAFDFQTQKIAGKELYKTVIETASSWEHSDRMMYVVGATKAAFLSEIRSLIPNSFLLVPGVGAQGGSLEEVYRHGSNDQVGLLVNSSRGIIYASDQKDFASAALDVAQKIQNQMAKLLTC